MYRFILKLICQVIIGLLIIWLFLIVANNKSTFTDYLVFLSIFPFLFAPSSYILFMYSYSKQIKHFEIQQTKDQLNFAQEIENAGK